MRQLARSIAAMLHDARRYTAGRMQVPAHQILRGTPAYGGQVHIDYVTGLLGYMHQGVRFGLMTIGNESLITRGRNTILATFHERREFTHLFFLDADVYLPPEGLK